MSLDVAQDWLMSYRQDQHGLFQKKAVKIAVTSGKGGVGKTSVSLLLARVIANLGKRVLLVDCDFNLSNTLVKLGLPLNDNFYSLLAGERPFEECIIKDKKFHLLAGCNGNVNLVEDSFKIDQFILSMIAEKEHVYDFIIFDSPAGVDKTNLILNAYCDYRFVVVVPDSSSITDSYSIMKLLYMKHNIKDNHLVINMTASYEQGERVVRKLAETSEHFFGGKVKMFGILNYIDQRGSEFDRLVKIADEKIFSNFYKSTKKFVDERLSRVDTMLSINTFAGKEQYAQI